MADMPPAVALVREKLLALGWTHADLTEALESKGVTVAQGLVSRWLSGQRSPDRARSAAIHELFPDIPPKLWTKPGEKLAKKKRRAA